MYGLNAIILWQAWGLTRGSDTGIVSGALSGGRSTNAFVGAAVVMLLGTMSWYNAGAGELPQGDSADLSALFEGRTRGRTHAGRYGAFVRVGLGEVHGR